MKVFASLPSDDEDKRKAWGAFISRVEDHRFKVNCCNELKSMYLNHDFYSQIDTNLDLVGFLNGVYDLRTGVFRDAKEDEYVTITTGYKYNSVRNEDQITLLKDTIGSSWDLAEERNYFFKHLASTLNGKKEETAHFWIGTGARNGKGTCAGLLMKALGARSQNFQWADWCAGIKGGSQAQPTLLNLKNKTCIIVRRSQKMNRDPIRSTLHCSNNSRAVMCFQPGIFTPQKMKSRPLCLVVCQYFRPIAFRNLQVWTKRSTTGSRPYSSSTAMLRILTHATPSKDLSTRI